MQLQCIAAFGDLQAKLQQNKVVVWCLGSYKDSVFVVYSY